MTVFDDHQPLPPGRRWTPPRGAQDIRRQCNQCRRVFYAESPFIRSCESCKKRGDWADGNDYLMAHLALKG